MVFNIPKIENVIPAIQAKTTEEKILRLKDGNDNIDYYYISRDDYNLVSKERDGSASCINDANDMILYYKNMIIQKLQ